MGVVKQRLLGAKLGFSGVWREVVDGRSSELRIPRRAGPVLESKLRRMHVIGA
jgi:hypothetical protein